MPAGNDATAAAANLADEFGTGGGDADKMIQHSRSRYRGDLGTAMLIEADESVEVDLEAVAKKAKVDKVLSAKVRGPYVTFVYELADGRVAKSHIGLDELSSKAVEDAESPEEKQAAKAVKKAAEKAEKEGKAEAKAEAKEEAKADSKDDQK